MTATSNNKIISALSDENYTALMPFLKRVALRRDQVVEVADEKIAKVYFPETAVLSLTASIQDGKALDAALIGFEGVSGISLVVGNELAVYTKIVRVPGTALELPAEHFVSALEQDFPLRLRLLRYIESLRYHLATATAAAAHMRLEARMARAFLMLQDRTEGRPIRITHAGLASMLGATRPATTTACRILQERGLVQCARREIEVVDRDGLVGLTNGSYGPAEAHELRLHQELKGAA